MMTADPIVPHATAMIAQNVKYPLLNFPVATERHR